MAVDWAKRIGPRAAVALTTLESETIKVTELHPGVNYIIEMNENWDSREVSSLLRRVIGPHFMLVPPGEMPEVMALSPPERVSPPGSPDRHADLVRIIRSAMPAHMDTTLGTGIHALIESIAHGVVAVYG